MNTDSTSQRIWQHSKATGVNKLMLLALAQHADINKDDDGFCWPSYQTLGGMVGLTGNPKSLKRNAIRNIAPLIKSGEVITWEQQGQDGGRGYTNIYLITVGLTGDQIKEIVQRRFNLEPDEVEIVLSKVGAKYDTLCSSERVSIKTLLETRVCIKGDISITHKAQEINKGDKGDTRLLESSSLESYPNKESLQDSSPNGEVPPPLPKEETIKVEYEVPGRYSPFLRDFLARFNAKRFRNPTQFKTVSDLVEQHGEAELESLAEWAANKGMGLGQAIPAIKSALKNPKRKAPDKSEDVPYVTPPDPIPPPARTPEQLIWQQVLADSPQIPQWLAAEIKPIPRSNGTFKLAVSSDSAKQWIDNRLVKVIKPTLNRIDQSISEIEVIVQ